MANTVIVLKKSGTPDQTPTSLQHGEIAINYADGRLFYKNATGEIVQIATGGGGGGNYFGTVSANGTLLVADTTNDYLTIQAGNNISINADSLYDSLTIAANLVSAYSHANAVGESANAYAASLTPDLSPPFNTANAAFIVANAAFERANVGAVNVNSFSSISVTGQGTILSSINDTLNIEAGNNINITTNTVSKTVLISSFGLGYTDYGSIAEPLTSAHDYGSL